MNAAREFAMMKWGVQINVLRGTAVATAALVAALDRGQISPAGAATEPIGAWVTWGRRSSLQRTTAGLAALDDCSHE